MSSGEHFTVSQQQQQHQPVSQSQLNQPFHVPYPTAHGTYRPMMSPQQLPYRSITGGITNPVPFQQININSSSSGATPRSITDGIVNPVPIKEINVNSDGGATPPVPNQLSTTSIEQKRKRGRPRKYGPDGNMALLEGAPQPPTSMQPNTLSPSSIEPLSHLSVVPLSVKKSRGRPPGSSNKKKQLEPIGSTGIGFLPHVINVKAGEDVCSKLMAFSQNGPRTVCVLSSSGAVSNVTLRQSETSGGTATYEGRFEILSLSGSYMLSELDVGGPKSRTGGLSITLAGPDGRVFGGCVAGLLIAASPVQVIVGSFLADGRKEPKQVTHHIEQLPAPPQLNFGGVAGTSSSPSRGTFSESSGGNGIASPPNLSSVACNNNHPQGMPSIQWK